VRLDHSEAAADNLVAGRKEGAMFNEESAMVRWLFILSCVVLVCLPETSTGAEAPSEKPVAIASGDAQLKWGPCPPLFPKGCEIAVLHGDLAKPNADVFLKVPANYVIPPHLHSSAERMVLVSGELHIEYTGYSPSVLKPGTYAYGPPKAPHKASCTDSEPCVLFIAFESPVDAHLAEGSQK
jgi:quercetin dioxygenase-like cupin family protein